MSNSQTVFESSDAGINKISLVKQTSQKLEQSKNSENNQLIESGQASVAAVTQKSKIIATTLTGFR
jgi:hypothetical protein